MHLRRPSHTQIQKNVCAIDSCYRVMAEMDFADIKFAFVPGIRSELVCSAHQHKLDYSPAITRFFFNFMPLLYLFIVNYHDYLVMVFILGPFANSLHARTFPFYDSDLYADRH